MGISECVVFAIDLLSIMERESQLIRLVKCQPIRRIVLWRNFIHIKVLHEHLNKIN